MKLNCKYFHDRYPKCTSCSQGSKITVKENNRKFILNNLSNKKVCKIQVDDCVIKDKDTATNTKKCDFLIVICESEKFYFVELKGTKLIQAVEQLTLTIERFQSSLNGQVFAIAVVSKSKKTRYIDNDGRVLKLRKLLKKKYRGDFKYRSQQYEEDV